MPMVRWVNMAPAFLQHMPVFNSGFLEKGTSIPQYDQHECRGSERIEEGYEEEEGEKAVHQSRRLWT